MQTMRQFGVFVIGALCGLLLSVSLVFAAEATSETFQLSSGGIDSGGNIASSSNFSIEGTIGAFISGELIASQSFQAGGTTGGGSIGGSSGTNQVSPEVSTIYFSYTSQGTPLTFADGVVLTPGTTTNLYIYGTVVDTNGAGTIGAVDVAFYRSGVSLEASCVADGADCYHVNNCTLSPVSTTAMSYECLVQPQYFADATATGSAYTAQSWVASVAVTDTTSFSSTKTAQIEMNSMLALDIPSSITFGELALGATTTADTNQLTTVTQRGNAVVDIEVSASADIACAGGGTIPKANISWARTDVGFTHASTTPLAVTPVRIPLGVAIPENTTPVTANVFWNIHIPDTGVQGSCSGAVTVSVLGA